MTEIGVGAVSSYLADSGWARSTETWHDATIWSNGSEEVLVPPRDGMGDSASRLRDLLSALESFESRPAGEIARDIAYPLLDTAYYRAPAAARPDGFVSLPSGLGAFQGMHDMFRTAASVVLAAPRFQTGAHHAVSELLTGIHIGTTSAHTFALTVLIPLESSQGGTPLGRQVLLQVHDATREVRQAVNAQSLAEFDNAAAAGVSAEFCQALSALAGTDLQDPFELGFRWARGLRADVPDQVLRFPAGAGELIQQGARRLEQDQPAMVAAQAPLDPSGPATITGRIVALHDTEGADDRWRVRIRGLLRMEDRRPLRRTIWVRLDSPGLYDMALAAHRDHSDVRVTGNWDGNARPKRLLAGPDGLQVITQNDQP
jgi:hypothetical protein